VDNPFSLWEKVRMRECILMYVKIILDSLTLPSPEGRGVT